MKVYKNGVESEVSEKDFDVPKVKEKDKTVKLGRKDTILLKLIASITGTSFTTLSDQLNILAASEPDSSGPN